ncbi:hypothetical protein QC763_0049810 [Podospora pseudopauciseta]|uniref:Uncharacterized protein n=1 Tax=Podospora pseudopauciseta TaxID=2093780 RepID=A0ABR0HFT8_9PEZI|nr:hypothetical protein QC763_0049810 [Podospora pseudopauciseta]
MEPFHSQQVGERQRKNEAQVASMMAFDDSLSAIDLDGGPKHLREPGQHPNVLSEDEEAALDTGSERVCRFPTLPSTESSVSQSQGFPSTAMPSPARQKPWKPHHRRQRKLTHRAAMSNATPGNALPSSTLLSSISLPNFPTRWNHERSGENAGEACPLASAGSETSAGNEADIKRQKHTRCVAAWKELQAEMKRRRQARRTGNDLAAAIEQMQL